MEELKAYLLLTATGAQLIVTRHNLAEEPDALKDLAAGGPYKFIAYEVPFDKVRESYSAHLEHEINSPTQKDEFIILDSDGRQVFRNISLKDIVNALIYEQEKPVSAP